MYAEAGKVALHEGADELAAPFEALRGGAGQKRPRKTAANPGGDAGGQAGPILRPEEFGLRSAGGNVNDAARLRGEEFEVAGQGLR